MDKHQFKQKWNELKGKLREKWSWMTESDVSEIHGDYDRWMSKMQKHGYSKNSAERDFQNWNMETQGWQREEGRMHNEQDRPRQENRNQSEQGWKNQGEWKDRGQGRSEQGGRNEGERMNERHSGGMEREYGRQENREGHSWGQQEEHKKDQFSKENKQNPQVKKNQDQGKKKGKGGWEDEGKKRKAG